MVPTPRDELEPFCKMAEEGLLDQDELDRIMKTQLELPASPVEPPSDPAISASDQPPDDTIQEK